MDMIPFEEAIRIVLDRTQEIDVVSVDLMDALGRTLAKDIRSDIDMPPFDKSAMDGYAVVGADIQAATPERPAVLDVVEEITAGTVPKVPVARGKAARIMTGAPIPEGADTVAMVEDTASESGGARVAVRAPTETGHNIVRLGEDLRRGQAVLRAGTPIRPPEIGILAAVGAVRLSVYRQPTVGILATGDEIVEPETVPQGGQIRNSNGCSMAAQVIRSGARPRYLGIVPDDGAALCKAISQGLEACDVLMLSGGVSAGAYDLVQGALRDCGVEILFDRIRMKPGKPLTFGVRGKALAFGLPGNPVSSVVGFELLARPAIRKMQGLSDLHRPTVRGTLTEGFVQTPGRKQFVPAWTQRCGQAWQTRWVGHHGSADLFSLCRANSLFVVAHDVETLNAGAEVDVILLTEW